jgi:hypothetical protein
MLEKALRPLRSQRLLSDGSRLGAGNAGYEYNEWQKALHNKSPRELVTWEFNKHASDPFALQSEFAAREGNAHEISSNEGQNNELKR